MMDLSAVLSSRRWTRRCRPFPHFVAEDVVRADVLASLTAGFHEVLARGLASRWDGKRFCKSASGYDAFVLPFSRSLPRAFDVVLSRAWHDMLAAVTGVPATGDIDGGLHHHLPGSADGWRHTDLTPGWFAGEARSGLVNLSDGRLCDYATGEPAHPGVAPRQCVRGAAMILFLANGPWRPGDGGETGLYGRPDGPIDRPEALVPPVDNSMVLFECTPHSYHAFRRNVGKARNSLILWIHRTREDAAAHFGERAIVPWRRAAGNRSSDVRPSLPRAQEDR